MTIVAMFAMMISCGEESNIGNGAKLSSTYNKLLYDDSSTVIVHEAWTWDDDYLKQFEYYYYYYFLCPGVNLFYHFSLLSFYIRPISSEFIYFIFFAAPSQKM